MATGSWQLVQPLASDQVNSARWDRLNERKIALFECTACPCLNRKLRGLVHWIATAILSRNGYRIMAIGAAVGKLLGKQCETGPFK
jgi:hypothetical protein